MTLPGTDSLKVSTYRGRAPLKRNDLKRGASPLFQPGRSETMTIGRRSFIKAAAAIGASFAWVGPARGSRVHWHERRDLYPQGVASGDPDPHSVILWTRRPFAEGARQLLTVEVAEDEAFHRVIAHANAPVASSEDWTA